MNYSSTQSLNSALCKYSFRVKIRLINNKRPRQKRETNVM